MSNVVDLQGQSINLQVEEDITVALSKPLELGLPPTLERKLEAEANRRRIGKALDAHIWRFRSFVFQNLIRPVRNYLYRVEGDRLIGELTTLAVRLNRPDFSVFVRIGGHIEDLHIEVYPKGWRYRDDTDGARMTIFSAKQPGRGRYNRSTPSDIRAAMKALIALSKLSTCRR